VALTFHHAAAALLLLLLLLLLLRSLPFPASPRGGRCVDRTMSSARRTAEHISSSSAQ